MKTYNVILILILFLIIASCATKPQPPTPKEIEVTIQPGVLETIEKTRPKEVVVHKIIDTKSEVWMDVLRKVTDIKGESKEIKDRLQITDKKLFLEIRKVSNSAFYGDMGKLWHVEPSPDKSKFNVPSDETAKKVTFEMLKRFGFSDSDMNNLNVSVTDELFEITLPDKTTSPIPVIVGKNIEVRRNINKLPVVGPGSKIKLYLGETDSVNGFMITWRQIQPSSSVLGHQPQKEDVMGEKVKPIDSKTAFEILKAKPLDHLPIALVEKIDIDQVNFGYYSRSAVEPQEYLQPVYVFSGTAHATLPDGKAAAVPYEQYVVALKEPMESIWPEQKLFKSDARKKGLRPARVEDKDEVVQPR